MRLFYHPACPSVLIRKSLRTLWTLQNWTFLDTPWKTDIKPSSPVRDQLVVVFIYLLLFLFTYYCCSHFRPRESGDPAEPRGRTGTEPLHQRQLRQGESDVVSDCVRNINEWNDLILNLNLTPLQCQICKNHLWLSGSFPSKNSFVILVTNTHHRSNFNETNNPWNTDQIIQYSKSINHGARHAGKFYLTAPWHITEWILQNNLPVWKDKLLEKNSQNVCKIFYIFCSFLGN